MLSRSKMTSGRKRTACAAVGGSPVNSRSRAGCSRIVATLAGVLFLAGCAMLDGWTDQPPKVNLDKRAMQHIAEAAQNSGEYGAAAGVYEKVVEQHPHDVSVQASFGEAALAAGELNKAADVFTKQVKLGSNPIEAHTGLGRIYLAEHEPAKALAEFKEVIAADATQVRALNGAGIALDLLNRNKEAQQSYRAALAIKPHDPAVRNNLGLSLALSGNYDQAIAELSKLTMEPSATPRMRQNLALALGLKGDDAGAAKAEHSDLDDKAIAENQHFFSTVRRLQGSYLSIEHNPITAETGR
jgi:Flp pilus assembly protein TadD